MGDHLGLAFQIVDDLLDQKREEKVSYVSVLGQKRSEEIVKEHTHFAKKHLVSLNLSHTPLIDLAEKLVFRRS